MKDLFWLFSFIIIFHTLSIVTPALGKDPEILIGRDYYEVLRYNLAHAKEDIVVAL